jgi:hypothetical protein
MWQTYWEPAVVERMAPAPPPQYSTADLVQTDVITSTWSFDVVTTARKSNVTSHMQALCKAALAGLTGRIRLTRL